MADRKDGIMSDGEVQVVAEQKPSFYAVQEADQKIEAQLEQNLMAAVRSAYFSNDYDTIKFSIIEVLEESRNFLYKYLDADDAIMLDIADLIEETRNYKKSKELMIEDYQRIRGDILKELGRLGFRRPMIERVPWDQKLTRQSQIKRDARLEEIFKKKAKTGGKSRGSPSSSTTPSTTTKRSATQ